MNYFASKKEAAVTAVIAAFFVLAAFALTVEPLVSVILANRAVPLNTTSLSVAAPGAKSADIIASAGKTAVKSDLLNKADDLLTKLGVISLAIQPNSFELETRSSAEEAVKDIRRFLSRLTPFDIKTILPDGTFMMETVIDPALVKVVNNKDAWTFTQTNPQIIVQKNGLKSTILVNNPQVGDIHGFESPTGCEKTAKGIKTIRFNPTRKPLVSSFFTSFSAYFRDYSCFQSFSTFTH